MRSAIALWAIVLVTAAALGGCSISGGGPAVAPGIGTAAPFPSPSVIPSPTPLASPTPTPAPAPVAYTVGSSAAAVDFAPTGALSGRLTLAPASVPATLTGSLAGGPASAQTLGAPALPTGQRALYGLTLAASAATTVGATGSAALTIVASFPAGTVSASSATTLYRVGGGASLVAAAIGTVVVDPNGIATVTFIVPGPLAFAAGDTSTFIAVYATPS